MRYAPTSTSTSTRSDASGVMGTRGHELLLSVDVGGRWGDVVDFPREIKDTYRNSILSTY